MSTSGNIIVDIINKHLDNWVDDIIELLISLIQIATDQNDIMDMSTL